MEKMKRYAVYYAPRAGAFAARAAEWLGWDPVAAEPRPQPQLPGLPAAVADLTAEPRKYGFHGTIRAPFRPADGLGQDEVAAGVAELASRLKPAVCDHLRLVNLHGFLALIPEGGEAALQALGAAVVEGTDALRAPLNEAEIARRRPERLSSRQRALLDRWGYPFVMEEFRFHLTLTSSLSAPDAAAARNVLEPHFAPVLPQPFAIEDLCLFGEDGAGRFHFLHRYALTG
ncbi:phosphonate metabolism protein [Gemmobacter nanjingensis]|uniref:Phosphonate metabolism protein n=2 Tax=Gemmobacter nanjingensis TaxID=488454 RepID=A0ABQ3FJS1_9RHOB|nr:phosphonate metabolism protein [Gemmobacter nanjingensis]